MDKTQPMNAHNNTNTSPAVEKLAYNLAELKSILGISGTTAWRLEKRGLLMPVPGIRHKLYSKKSVERFLEGQK